MRSLLLLTAAAVLACAPSCGEPPASSADAASSRDATTPVAPDAEIARLDASALDAEEVAPEEDASFGPDASAGRDAAPARPDAAFPVDAGCKPTCVPGTCNVGDGCGGSCSCDASQTCLGQACCATDRVCGSACCTGNESCDLTGAPTCRCIPEDASGFCSRLASLGRDCGVITAPDNCGAPRTVDCGASACAAGETCSTALNACQCTAAPDSCLAASPTTYCEVTGRCVDLAVTCKGVVCAPGQVCIDLDAPDPFTGTGAKTCSCIPENLSASNPTDLCAKLGKVCNMDRVKRNASTCRRPYANEPCRVGVSNCAGAGVACKVSSAGGAFCKQSCDTTADCPDRGEECMFGGPSRCVTNVCATTWVFDAAAHQSVEVPGERAKYFQPCKVWGVGDEAGTCLPQMFPNTEGTAYVDLGICFQKGLATGSCKPNATRAETGLACVGYQVCEPVQPGATAGTLEGICRPACNSAPTPDPAAPCSAGQTCWGKPFEEGRLRNADEDCVATGQKCSMRAARLGVCEESCSVLDSALCATPDALGNPTGCAEPFFDGAGVCLAVAPAAATAGQACDPAADLRKPCAGELACPNGVCVGYCDRTLCPDPALPCPGCLPAGAHCVPGMVGSLGTCAP